MVSITEQSFSRSLGLVLEGLPVGADIAGASGFDRALVGLERFVPELLMGIYPEWKGESLDGFDLLVARKTADCEAELFGLCILISDQTLTPFHLRVRLAADEGEVAWLVCRLGERDREGRMIRLPYPAPAKHLHALQGREEQIEWVYAVRYDGSHGRASVVPAAPRP